MSYVARQMYIVIVYVLLNVPYAFLEVLRKKINK